MNILFDRLTELWEGTPRDSRRGAGSKKNVRFSQPVSNTHMISQADYLDDSGMQNSVFPPAPVATTKQSSLMNDMMGMSGGGSSGGAASYSSGGMMGGPMAANTLLGGSFGSSF